MMRNPESSKIYWTAPVLQCVDMQGTASGTNTGTDQNVNNGCNLNSNGASGCS